MKTGATEARAQATGEAERLNGYYLCSPQKSPVELRRAGIVVVADASHATIRGSKLGVTEWTILYRSTAHTDQGLRKYRLIDMEMSYVNV